MKKKKEPELRTLKSNIIKYSVIISKSPTPTRIWCLMTGLGNRHLPMQRDI